MHTSWKYILYKSNFLFNINCGFIFTLSNLLQIKIVFKSYIDKLKFLYCPHIFDLYSVKINRIILPSGTTSILLELCHRLNDSVLWSSAFLVLKVLL